MKREELAKKLSIVKPGLSAQSHTQQLICFCFTNNELVTYNGKQAIITKFPLDVEFGVPGEFFQKFIDSYKTEDIAFQLNDYDLVVTAGRSRDKFAILPKDKFVGFIKDRDLKLVEIRENTKFSFEIDEEFFRALEHCHSSAGSNPLEPDQYGIVLVSEGETTCLYSTNNNKISRYIVNKKVSDQPIKVLLPKVFCEILISEGKLFAKGKISVGQNFCTAEFEDGSLVISELLKTSGFYDFEELINLIIKNNLGKDYQSVPEGLVDILGRCIILTSDEKKNNSVLVNISGTLLSVTAKSAIGEVVESVNLKEDLGQHIFRMDPVAVKEALEITESIMFSILNGSVLLVSRKGNNYLHFLNSLEK